MIALRFQRVLVTSFLFFLLVTLTCPAPVKLSPKQFISKYRDFYHVPDDVIRLIYSFLEDRDQLQLYAVNRLHNRIYSEILARITPASLRDFRVKTLLFHSKIRPILKRYGLCITEHDTADLKFNRDFAIRLERYVAPADVLLIVETFIKGNMNDEFEPLCLYLRIFRDQIGANALHLAAKMNLHRLVRRIVFERALLPAHSADTRGMTPLHYAVASGAITTMEILLADDMINVNASSEEFGTPLMLALQKGNQKVVEILLNDPRVDVDENNPLYRAVQLELTEMITMLVKSPRVNVNTRVCRHLSPLHAAVLLDRKMAFDVLLACPDIDIWTFDYIEGTILHTAVINRSPDMVEKILHHEWPFPEPDRTRFLNHRNTSGYAALHYAVALNNMTIMRLLLREPTIDMSIKTNDGKSLVQLAQDCGLAEMKRVLEKARRRQLMNNLRQCLTRKRSNKIAADG